MKKLLLYFLLLPALAFGQISKKQMFFMLSNSGSASAKVYVDLPTPPTFTGSEGTDYKLLDVSMGSSVTQAELTGAIKKGLVPNPYTNMMRANQLVGTEGAPFIFKSADDNVYSVVGGATLLTGSTIFDQTGATISDWVEFHHMHGLGHNGVASLTGAGWTGKAGGSNLLLSDLIIESTQSPGVQFNGDGDAGTYGNMRMHFLVVHGDNTDNECYYFGDTSPTGFGIVNTLTATHLFGTDKGWDGLQMNSIQNTSVSNVTLYDVGKSAASGQKSLLQAQNLGDDAIIENSIFHTAPKAFQIAGRSMTIRNCSFASDEEGFAQSMSQAGYAGGDILSTSGGDIIFENIYFDSTTPRTYAVNLNEPNANYYFVNVTIDTDITSLYVDNRVAPTGNIYQYNTTTGAANLPTPTFVSLSPTNTLSGCITNDYYYNLGQGHRTPAIDFNRPTLSDIDPATGTTDDVITITGTNFTGATHVTIGNTAAASFVVNSDTEIEATVGAGTTGLVRVITPSGMVKSSETFTFSAPFNPFTDLTWVAAFNPTDFDGTTWPNQGSGADAVIGSATDEPALAGSLSTRSGSGLVFVNASGTGLQYGTGTVSEPFETWIELITPASFTSTQRIYANGNATRLTILNTGAISVAGTADVVSGVTLSANTRYVLRILNSGASSSITVNNGTPSTFTLTAQNGSSTPKLGHAYSAGSGHWTGTMGDFFQSDTVLSAGEITDMWTWFGF